MQQGLTSAQVAQRVAKGAVNATARRSSRTVGQILRANVLTRFNAIIAVLCALILIFGQLVDALFGLVIVVNSAVGVIQELRAKQTLDRLALLAEAPVRVLRDGREVPIRPGEVVLDDLVLLGPADRVPVDGVVEEADGVEVDESLLTGESEPVEKRRGDEIRSGTFVAAGSCRLAATGVGEKAYAAWLVAEASRFELTDSELMRAREPGPRYVIANGDEGDPGSYCDRLLMEQDPHRILEGLALAAFATGARHGLVLVRSEYPAAVARMRTAVLEARAAGHLGRRIHGSGFDFDVEVVEGAGSYVAGEETALTHTVSGLRGDARPRPPYPTSKGFLARPTVLNNVETLAAVPWVLRHGGAAYARLGHPDEPGTKLVCLSQLFRRPGVYEVEYGVPLRYLVEDLGGGLREGRTLRSVQVGGPLGGFLTPDQLELPLLTRSLAQPGVPLGHASLIAFDTEMPAAAILRHEWAFGAAESCGACTPCRVGTRRGLELVERIGELGQRAVLARQEPLLEVLDVASLCAFGRGVACAVRSVTRAYSDELSRSAP